MQILYKTHIAIALQKDAHDRGRNLSYAEAARMVNRVFSFIQDSLTQGNDINIARFGTFFMRTFKPKNGINPYTEERKLYPAKTHVRFRAHKQLKEKTEK